MRSPWMLRIMPFVSLALAVPATPAAAAVPVNLDRYDAASGITVTQRDDTLLAQWTVGTKTCEVVFRLAADGPLLQHFTLLPVDAEKDKQPALLRNVDPALYLTIGTRERPRGSNPAFPWWIFFDNPAKRPHQTHRSQLDLKSVDIVSRGKRTTVRIGELTAGSFRGAWEFTFFDGSTLVQLEAVLATDEPSAAVVYDLGLVGLGSEIKWINYLTPRDVGTGEAFDPDAADRSLAVKRRSIFVQSRMNRGVFVFPPPHQFYFPRDYSDNLSDIWLGKNHAGFGDRPGVGVRQAPTGGGNWVPWCNAPPGTQQRFGMFLLGADGDPGSTTTYDLLRRYTHDDEYVPIPGHKTLTSHYHMAVAIDAMRRKAEVTYLVEPEFIGVFKNMGVNIVHLGEFHGDGHPKDPGPLRMPELEAMFQECKRHSSDRLLFIPGEEINEYLGITETGKHPGHWMSLFPRPVYWMQKRGAGEPFVVDDPKLGPVYRVGSKEDMQRMIAAEGALVWSAHPRIKASSWAPDAFKDEDFFRDKSWLGAAFKAMPADLSEPRLGRRCLDLLDEMSNWGAKKYLPGEVDVFKIDRTHELYGHMNINYLRLDEVPKFDDGWQPVLDVLQRGAFFTTTGEVLIRSFTVGGKPSGETLSAEAARDAELEVELSWTFPPTFAEIITGDGEKVFRERIDLTGEREFGSKTIRLKPQLAGRRWVRFEAWDCAVNGAYTQPIWIE